MESVWVDLTSWWHKKTRMSALEPEVERKLVAVFPQVSDQACAREALLTYINTGSGGTPRVRLAILKLSDGSLDELRSMIVAAQGDPRDVLMWAESPEQGSAAGSPKLNMSASERRKLAKMRARDRKQYEAWLKR